MQLNITSVLQKNGISAPTFEVIFQTQERAFHQEVV